MTSQIPIPRKNHIYVEGYGLVKRELFTEHHLKAWIDNLDKDADQEELADRFFIDAEDYIKAQEKEAAKHVTKRSEGIPLLELAKKARTAPSESTDEGGEDTGGSGEETGTAAPPKKPASGTGAPPTDPAAPPKKGTANKPK